jgi:hypothetical protein
LFAWIRGFQGLWRYYLVMHVVVWGNRVAAQQGYAQLNQAWAVAACFVGDGADDGTLVVTHLVEYLGYALLACDGEILFPACVAHGVQHAKSAGIGSGGYQDVLAFALAAEKIRNRQLAGLPHTAPFQTSETICGQIGEPVTDAIEGAGNAAINVGTCLGISHTQYPVDPAVPLAQGVLG